MGRGAKMEVNTISLITFTMAYHSKEWLFYYPRGTGVLELVGMQKLLHTSCM